MPAPPITLPATLQTTLPITLRRATVADAAAHARIMGDPQVLANLMQLPYASVDLWQQRLADNNLPGKTDLALVAEQGGVVVGSAGLHPAVQLRRRHVAMLGISVAREAQGRGVGHALMQGLCDYADGWAPRVRHQTPFPGGFSAVRSMKSMIWRCRLNFL